MCIFPLPSCLTCPLCRESYIYWVLRNNSSVPNVAITLSCDTLILTTSSSSSCLTSSPFFFLPQERVSWTSFGYLDASFPIRSLGFVEMFSNSHLSIFIRLSLGPASCLTIMRTIWSEWTQAWWSPWVSLVFKCLWPPLSRSSLPADCSGNHLIWVDSIRSVPIGLQ